MGDTRAAPAAPYGCKRTAPKDDLWRRVGWPDGWSAEADWRMPGDVVGRAEGEEHGRCGEGSSQHSANCLRRVRGPPCCHSGGPPATMGGPSAQRRPHSGRPQFEGGRPEGGPAAQARRPGRPIGPPDFRGWPPTFGWRAARFWSEGRPIWRPGGPGGGRAARSPLTADSTTYGTPVPSCATARVATRPSTDAHVSLTSRLRARDPQGHSPAAGDRCGFVVFDTVDLR